MKPLISLSKKSLLPAEQAFVISFLPRVSLGKKYFYPCYMHVEKAPTGIFRRFRRTAVMLCGFCIS